MKKTDALGLVEWAVLQFMKRMPHSLITIDNPVARNVVAQCVCEELDRLGARLANLPVLLDDGTVVREELERMKAKAQADSM